MDVTIRPLEVSDAYTSVVWRNDPEVFKYTGNTYDHIITIESELNWIKRVISKPDDYRCAILVNGKYVGNIYLTDIKDGIGHYHIFIGDKTYWRKGVAKAASKLIIDYGFNQASLTEIELKVNEKNTSAMKLYESLGFQRIDDDGKMICMSLKKRFLSI